MPRLPGYDYKSIGAYFITICTAERRLLFGSCAQGKTHLFPLGKLVEEIWTGVPIHQHAVKIDEFVVMPNHIHGILWFEEPTCRCEACLAPTGDRSGSLSTIIGLFKAAVTKQARDVNLVSHREPLWQRNYHDHIIRNESSLTKIQNYILDNPLKWETDEYFSNRML